MPYREVHSLTLSPVNAIVFLALLAIGFLGRMQLESREKDQLQQRNFEPMGDVDRIADEPVVIRNAMLQVTPTEGWFALRCADEPNEPVTFIDIDSGCLVRFLADAEPPLTFDRNLGASTDTDSQQAAQADGPDHASDRKEMTVTYDDVTVRWQLAPLSDRETRKDIPGGLVINATMGTGLVGVLQGESGPVVIEVRFVRGGRTRSDLKNGALARLCNGIRRLK